MLLSMAGYALAPMVHSNVFFIHFFECCPHACGVGIPLECYCLAISFVSVLGSVKSLTIAVLFPLRASAKDAGAVSPDDAGAFSKLQGQVQTQVRLQDKFLRGNQDSRLRTTSK